MIADSSTFKVGNNSNGTLKVENASGDNKVSIQTEIGSKLEINKLLADKGSSVHIDLDLAKADKPENPISTSQVTSTQKNFNI